MTPAERVVDALAAQGCNPRQAGPTQWTARCPVQAAHKRGDKNPSLSLGESPTGYALLTCHTGCTVPAITEALNLGMRDLFPSEPPRSPIGGPLGTPKARYPYHDEHGELLYEVVKYVQQDGRKTFRARAPLPDGTWSHSVSGVRRVVYGLPAVLAAVRDGRPVVICEGEKDAETAAWMFADLGAATTCNPFGAGKWDGTYNQWFRGATVTIIADDDPVGRAHAYNIETHLSGIAATVTVMLPALGHNDLSEMAGANLTRHDLRPSTGTTDPDTGDTEPETDLVAALCVNWTEFWTLDHKSEEWAIEPLIPAGRAVSIYAPAKVGKSWVLLSAVVPAVLGHSVWGLPATNPIRVLYLDYEMTAGDLRERLEQFGYGPEHDLTGLAYALIPSLPPLDTAEGGQAVLALALAHEANVVIMDTFGRAAQGDENDADTTRAFYRHTGGLLKAQGVATCRTDHAGKDADKGQRGSSAKNDDVDVVWKLARTDSGNTLTRTHSRVMWVPESIALELHDGDDGIYRYRRSDGPGWSQGTKEAATRLDELGLPLDISGNKAMAALLEAGHGAKRRAVLDAVKYRRHEAARLGNVRVPPRVPPQNGTPVPAPGTTQENTDLPAGTTPGTTGYHPPSHWYPESASLEAVPVPTSPAQPTPEKGIFD